MNPIDREHAGRTNGAARGESVADSLPPLTLAEAFHRTIHGHGFVLALAQKVGVPAKHLYRWGTTDSDEHRNAPADVIVPLIRATGRYDILHFLAAQLDCFVVARPTITHTPADLVRRIAGVVQETGDVQTTSAELLDGITPREARVLDQQISEAQAALERLRLEVTAAVKKPGAKAVAR